MKKTKTCVIGLSGSIGMGKTTTAGLMRKMGIAVYDADRTVHELYQKNKMLIKKVIRLFPECFVGGKIDRRILGAIVFRDTEKLKKLEEIIHPFVVAKEKAFIAQGRKQGRAFIALEIQLLFETGANKRCDIVFCVTAPASVQKKRVLLRAGMNEARFKAILKRQWPDAKKRKASDYVIQTGKGLADTKRQLKHIFSELKGE